MMTQNVFTIALKNKFHKVEHDIHIFVRYIFVYFSCTKTEYNIFIIAHLLVQLYLVPQSADTQSLARDTP